MSDAVRTHDLPAVGGFAQQHRHDCAPNRLAVWQPRRPAAQQQVQQQPPSQGSAVTANSRLPRWMLGLRSTAAALPALFQLASPLPAHALSPSSSASAHAPLKLARGANLPPTSGSGQGGGGGSGGGGGGPGPQPLALLAAAREPVVLTVASFAVTKMAYVRLTKTFREEYLKETGVDVRFRLTFTGSGVQARAVIDGLPADMVALALPLDIDKIAAAGLLRPDWPRAYPNNSVVCETTVAFVTRRGNPHNIHDWDDLTRPGLQIVLANPKTAGVARWIFLALWGHRMRRGDAAALDYVTRVFENVVVQPRDAREASDVFYRQRMGDVLLTYENEVVLTNQVYGGDKALPYAVPSPNVRISCPLALVDKVLDAKPAAARQAAHAFAKFCFTPHAQVEFGRVGFRPNPKLCREQPEHLAGMRSVRLWSVEDALGGWAAAQRKFFDAGCILDRIQAEVGARRMAQRQAGAVVQRHRA